MNWMCGYVQNMPESSIAGEDGDSGAALYEIHITDYPMESEPKGRALRSLFMEQRDMQEQMPLPGDHITVCVEGAQARIARLVRKKDLPRQPVPVF